MQDILSLVNCRADDADDWPVFVCLLGDFRLLKAGQPVPLRSGGKVQTLLCALAMQPSGRVPRDTLLDMIWPDSEAKLAGQSLNTLVYSLHKLLSDALGEAPPVLLTRGCYRLNVEAGVGVDIASFEAAADTGDRAVRAGDSAGATRAYHRAGRLYVGDLCAATDLQAVILRERLRARYLTLLAQQADCAYTMGDYESCLEHAQGLLAHDPCREDAHRLVMRCYVRQGERAQAVRQYRLCEEILRAEWDASPEAATMDLFMRVRLDPNNV